MFVFYVDFFSDISLSLIFVTVESIKTGKRYAFISRGKKRQIFSSDGVRNVNSRSRHNIFKSIRRNERGIYNNDFILYSWHAALM